MTKTPDLQPTTPNTPTLQHFTLMDALLRDPTADPHSDPAYSPLISLLADLLSTGYSFPELAAEFALTQVQTATLKGILPNDFVARHSSSSIKHLARKRAALLTDPHSSHNFSMLQTLDPAWNPKTPPVSIQISHELTKEDREKIDEILPPHNVPDDSEDVAHDAAGS